MEGLIYVSGLETNNVTMLSNEGFSLASRTIYKYVCHFLFTYYFFFSFTFYFLIQCLASLWVNFSSVIVSEINPDHIIYRLATELNKPKNIYVYF